jgi:hypothetical protein
MKNRKTGGRKTGTPNRTNAETRAALIEIVEKRFENIEQRLDECEAKDELNILIKLIELCIPKPQPENVEATSKSPDFYSEMLIRLNRPAEGK